MTIEELWSGPGVPIAKPHGAVATKGAQPAVYFVLGGAIERLDLPPDRRGASTRSR